MTGRDARDAIARLRSLERWSPLACYGFSISANQMLAAKLLAIYWIEWRLSSGFTRPYLSFLPFLERHEIAAVWPILLAVAYVGATLALLLNRAPRTSAAVCAAVIFADVLAVRSHYANSTLISGFVLALIALQTRERGLWMLRAQVVLLYGGASLNKLLAPDWRSGQYMEFWTQGVMSLEWLAELAAKLPGSSLYVVMSWLVIVTEASLAALLAVPRLFGLAAALVVTFHVSMLVFTEGRVSWIFGYAAGAAMLALWRWPEPSPGARPPWWRQPVTYFGLALLFTLARGIWEVE